MQLILDQSEKLKVVYDCMTGKHEICIFPFEDKNSKWAEYTIHCSDESLSIMQEILKHTSLIRLSDLQTIEKIITKALQS